MRYLAPAVGAVLCCGCHLIFPFSVTTPATDGAPDQAPTTDAVPDGQPKPDRPPGGDAPRDAPGDLPPALDGPKGEGVPTNPHVWSKAFGNTAYCMGQEVATGPAGHVYWAGYYNGTCKIGSTTLAGTSGKWNGFVASFTSKGGVRWVQELSCIDYLYAIGLTVDSKGIVYVTGNFKGLAYFNKAQYISAGQDAFVASYTSAGAPRWFRALGGGKTDHGFDVAVDGADKPVVVGRFTEKMSVGSTILTGVAANDAFVARLDPSNGAPKGGARVGGLSSVTATSVVADAAGNAYATINFYGNITKPFAITNKGSGVNLLLVRVSTNNTIPSWIDVGGTSVEGNGLALDSASNLYVTGAFSNTVDFGGTSRTAGVSPNLFLAGYTKQLALKWVAVPAAAKAALGMRVAARPSSSVHVVGHFQDAVIFGSNKLVASGLKQDVLAARYTASGTPDWSMRFGAAEMDLGHSVAADAMGSVYISGSFQKTVDFGGGPRACPGSTCAYLVKLSP